MSNKIISPYPNISGYATIIKSARKDHKCRECNHRISKGSTYISIHESAFEGSVWNSFPICEECYQKLISKIVNLDAVSVESVTSKLTEVTGGDIRARIKTVYQTSDNKTFINESDALQHEKFIVGKSKLIMASTDGITENVDEALAVCIIDQDALYAFDMLCRRSQLFTTKLEALPDQIRYGIYLRNRTNVKFSYVKNDTANALKLCFDEMLSSKTSE